MELTSDHTALRMRFYLDFASERRRHEELLSICEFLHVRCLTSGSVINFRPPYRTLSSVMLRHQSMNNEQWESMRQWCADNEIDVLTLEDEEPLLSLRLRDIGPAFTDEVDGWLKENNIECAVSAFSVIDANTFQPILLTEYEFADVNDAIYFKLRWSDFIGSPSPHLKQQA